MYIMYIFLEKKAKLFANSGDLIRLCSVASDLGLHCCQLPFSSIQNTMD